MTYLVLYLDAVLQSWGYASKYNQRTTLPYPTKSGIVGMLCAAMGIERSNIEKIEELVKLKMWILVLNAGIRLIDFHTVGGGYDKNTQKQYITGTANGSTGRSIITYREYLQDAKFGVILAANEKQALHIKESLIDPKWGIWLGRKCCIPSSPVFQGLYDNYDDALAHLQTFSKSKEIRMIQEVDNFADGTDTLHDIPINFETREFSIRRISEEFIE